MTLRRYVKRRYVVRRYVARVLPPSASAIVWLNVVASYNVCSAQVGHDPSRSPYRDAPRGGTVLITGGYLGGSRGGPGVGISDGPTGGLRYERSLGGAIGFSTGIAYGRTARFVIDPAKDSVTRKTGPVDAEVIVADVGLQFVLTGRKTWHGLAPFLGASLGVALGGGPPDPGLYDFGNKIVLAPEAGLRWHPARRVSVRTDFRLALWKLTYPTSYKVPNAIDGGSVLPPNAKLTEWTAHPWIAVGVGWTF